MDFIAQQISLISNSRNRIIIQYDNEIPVDKPEVQCNYMNVKQTSTTSTNDIIINNNKYDIDNKEESKINITCNPLTPLILDFSKTLQNTEIIIENNSPVTLKSQNNTSYPPFQNTKDIIEKTSDIQIRNIDKCQELTIKDSIGTKISIDNTADKQQKTQTKINYKSTSNKITTLFIGSFNKIKQSVKLNIETPRNLILHSNDNSTETYWNTEKEDNFIFIKTIDGQIICTKNMPYVYNIVNEIKNIIKPIIQLLISKKQYNVIKELIEFTVTNIVHNINRHVDTIYNSDNNNKETQQWLKINKIQRIILNVIQHIEKNIKYKFIDKETIEQTKQKALEIINQEKYINTSTSVHNTKIAIDESNKAGNNISYMLQNIYNILK